MRLGIGARARRECSAPVSSRRLHLSPENTRAPIALRVARPDVATPVDRAGGRLERVRFARRGPASDYDARDMFGCALPLLPSFVAALAAQEAPARTLAPRWIATEHLGRLTNTATNQIRDVGLAGTDLGVSFEASGRLVFLFGDSWTVDKQDWDADSVALAPLSALARESLPKLEWLTRASSRRFLPLAPKDLALGGMNVPVEGVASGDRTYVFFDGGWDAALKRHTHSILAHTRKHEFGSLTLDHSVASDKFLNVSVVVDAGMAWIFGTGVYRKSSVYLARVRLADIADRSAWRYWPSFEADEAQAQPLVEASDYGELSVRRLRRSGLWCMSANSGSPRGIHLRTASAPTGPWSAPQVIFDPARDRGYGGFMHQSASAVGFDDGLSEAGRENEWGGEYGPYLVPAWCSEPVEGAHGLVFTLSSWNPYQVHLMRAWLTEPGVTWTPPQRVAGVAATKDLVNADFASGDTRGWRSEGETFAIALCADGSRELTTYVKPLGDATRGSLSQEFTVPAEASELRFLIKGGSESVRLWRGDELLRETRGRKTNDVETQARWTIDDFRGQRVRVEIADESSARWGFVTVRKFELVR